MDTKEIMQAIRRTRIKTLYSAYSEGAITYGDYRYSLRDYINRARVLLAKNFERSFKVAPDYINRARVLLGQAPYTPNEYEIAWQNRTLAAENWTRARDEIANVILRNF